MYVSNYIRKIDELGRIVIPKEIRSKLKIIDNENILIKDENDKIVISKYSYLNNYQKFVTDLCNYVSEIFKVYIRVNNIEKEIFNNVKNPMPYKFEDDIIKDSITIGKISLFSTYNDYSQLTKLISKIIADYLENI